MISVDYSELKHDMRAMGGFLSDVLQGERLVS